MKTSLWELQKALFLRLSQDDDLTNRVSGVFDDVDKNTPCPYVTIGEPIVSPFETKTSFGENMTIVIHCFSQYNGKKEAYDILNLIMASLSKSPLRLGGGFSLVDFRLDRLQVITDSDGTTKHGILSVRYWINN